jgi:hypothetical protein
MEQRIVQRISGVEIPDIPWNERLLKTEEARRMGLVTLNEISSHLGIHRWTVTIWRRRFEDFPSPKAKLITNPTGRCLLFSIEEFHAWFIVKKNHELIRGALKKS